MNDGGNIHIIEILKSYKSGFLLTSMPLMLGYIVVAVESLSRVWLFATPWTEARQASLSFTLPEFAQIRAHWAGDAI